MLDANDVIVEGNANTGIAYNGEQYFVIVNGDKIGTKGNDITFARKVLQEKTGRSK